ncbi:MAG: cation:proton antiporter [Thermoanaerobaculia bacterium]
MESHAFIVLLGFLLIVAFGAEQAFRWVRVPPVLVLMGCGLVVGPLFGLLPAADFLAVAPHFGAVAFLLILFEGGLDLDLDRVLKALGTALRLALVSFGGAALTVFPLALAGLGWPWRDALVLAIVLAPVSGAILIPLLGRLTLGASLRPVLILEAALADVLGVLALSLAGQIIDVGGIRTLVAFGTLLAAAASVLAGLAAGWLWPRAMRSLGEHSYVDVLTFGVALTLWGGVSLLGASGALAVFTFGFALANLDELKRFLGRSETLGPTEYDTAALHSFVSQMNFLMRAFFFVFIGVVVQVGALSRATLIFGAVASALFLFTRWAAIVRVRSRWKGDLPTVPLPLLVLLQPRGLVTAVLAIEAAHLGLPHGEAVLPIASVVILVTNVAMGVGLVVWGGGALGSAPTPAAGPAPESV